MNSVNRTEGIEGIDPVILINPDFQGKVDAFCARLQGVQEKIENLPEADAVLFKPLLEDFFGLLGSLVGNFTRDEGHSRVEAAGKDGMTYNRSLETELRKIRLLLEEMVHIERQRDTLKEYRDLMNAEMLKPLNPLPWNSPDE